VRGNLLTLLKEYELSECHKLFRSLLESEIQTWREANDNATQEDVLRNQGAIAAFKKVLKAVTPKDVEDLPTYDGGFGN
jgi:hypothetical protein